jgi:hypothetical protein
MKKICGLSIDFLAFLGVLLLLAWIVALPNYVNGGPAPLNKVINNLRVIEGAKDQWSIENKKEKGALPTLSELAPYLDSVPKPGNFRFHPGAAAGATPAAKLFAISGRKIP